MKIIALYATRNRGKTTTLNKLIDLLSLVAGYYEINRAGETCAYFEINGKGVTVCTPGDNEEAIKANIKFFMNKEHKKDVLVTTSHKWGETVNEINDFTDKKKADLVWVKKVDDESKNALIAAGLLGLVRKEVYPEFDDAVQPAEGNQ